MKNLIFASILGMIFFQSCNKVNTIVPQTRVEPTMGKTITQVKETIIRCGTDDPTKTPKTAAPKTQTPPIFIANTFPK